MDKYILGLAVFICGAVVMIFELVGSRMLGPYFGTSIFVWTSLIGVILGSLSFGYYWGGKLADKKPSFRILSLVIFAAGIFIGLSALTKDYLLIALQSYIPDILLASVLASLALFLPASVFLGMVSPYAAKLKINSLDKSGSIIGNLYALSTIGSIAGTFLAGFYLIPNFGTNKLLLILPIILAITSLTLCFKKDVKTRLLIFVLIIGSGVMTTEQKPYAQGKTDFLDIDTAYNRVWIYNSFDFLTKRPIKLMGINNESQSAMFLNSQELVYEYTKYYHLIKHFKPDFKKVLMIGAAGYSYPKDFLTVYSEAVIDVVEIDPKLTELAQKYFELKPNPRLGIYHQDGRTYLNTVSQKYDAILIDAFGARCTIPYQLTTQEALQKQYDSLNDDGLVVLNIISAIEGEGGRFLRAEYATYKMVFPQVYLFPVNDKNNGAKLQNIMLVALKSEKQPDFANPDPILNQYLKHRWTKPVELDTTILTDDFAPVEYYIYKAIKT
jgi:spermidine synthase